MKVVVTGGTGFIGVETVGQLLAAGHEVRIIARKPASRSSSGDARVEVFSADIQDAASLVPAVRGGQAVVHLVGVISEAGKSTFENIHVKGTENVLDAAVKCGVQRIIHMSALGTRPQAVSRYHQTKWAAEERVRRSGLEFSIIRPSLVYGPRDHFVNLFAKIARWSPVVPMLGRPDALFQPVQVECVARAFTRSLEVPGSIGRTYDLCGPERLTLGQIIDEILAATGRRRLKIHIPGPLAAAQASLMEFVLRRLLRKPSPLNRDQLIMLGEDNVGEPSPANTDFGLNSKSFREGIRVYLR